MVNVDSDSKRFKLILMTYFQRGFSALILLMVFFLVSSGIIVGSFYIKSNHPELLNKINEQKTDSETSATITNTQNKSRENDLTLNGWLEYLNDDFGLKFKYPPQFKQYGWGDFSDSGLPGNTGYEICVNLDGCLIDKVSNFEIRATTVGWQGSQPARFTDMQGYREDNGKYFARFNSEEFEIPASLVEKIKSSKNVEILIVKGSSGDKVNRSYPEVGWIGALINRDLPVYRGVAVKMKLVNDLNEEIFKKILSTFDFVWDNNFPSDEEVPKETSPSKDMDSLVKYDIAIVLKIVHCRFEIDGKYPKAYYPDAKCGTAGTMKNPFTSKPYYYTPTNNGQGFIIKAKLSTGEVYAVTEKTNPN